MNTNVKKWVRRVRISFKNGSRTDLDSSLWRFGYFKLRGYSNEDPENTKGSFVYIPSDLMLCQFCLILQYRCLWSVLFWHLILHLTGVFPKFPEGIAVWVPGGGCGWEVSNYLKKSYAEFCLFVCLYFTPQITYSLYCLITWNPHIKANDHKKRTKYLCYISTEIL